MSEKKLSSDGTVLPVEIKIKTYKKLYDENLFDKEGQPVFIIEKRKENLVDEHYETFTDELYLELLCVNDTKKAEAFINKYPHFCIASHEDFIYKETDFVISKKDYLYKMLYFIEQFKQASDIYKKVVIILKEPDNTNEIQNLVSFVNIKQSIRNHEQRVSLADIFGKGILYDVIFYDQLIDDFIRFIEQKTSMVKSMSFFKPTLELCCPSLLSAMYQKLIISEYNNEEYRQCANKHCTNYFKVGNRKTRKVCDKHLESRRRKQQKYLYGIDI